MPFGQDANFTEEALVERLNADLANDLGNLVSRATTLIANFGAPGAPAADRILTPDAALSDAFQRTRQAVDEAMAEFAFQRALLSIWEFIGVVNRYVDSEQPWALAKDPAKAGRLVDVLVTLADALRCLAIVLKPFLPGAAEKILRSMGEDVDQTLEAAVFGRTWHRPEDLRRIQKLSGLFPRVDVDKEAARPGASGAPATRGATDATAPTARLTIDEFKRLDLRVAEVVAAEAVPKSKKLLKLTVRLADETRTVVAGIAEHYRPDALVGRKVVVVANLEAATLMGVTSNGMVLAGSAGDTLALLAPDRDLPSGAKVR
jgi:methionyl-tRNA synthetase